MSREKIEVRCPHHHHQRQWDCLHFPRRDWYCEETKAEKKTADVSNINIVLSRRLTIYTQSNVGVMTGIGLYRELQTNSRDIRATFKENLKPQIGRRIDLRDICRLNDLDEPVLAFGCGCIVDYWLESALGVGIPGR